MLYFVLRHYTFFHFADVVKDVRVSCNSEDITLTISTYLDQFNGLVYPKGLSKNSSCMTEYIQEGSAITYVLTLRSCNTMSTDVVSYAQKCHTRRLAVPSTEWDSPILLAEEECLLEEFTLWGVHSVGIFCKAFLTCSVGCWADSAATVQPNR